MTRRSQIGSLFVAATLVFVLAGTATILYAQGEDANVIHACVLPGFGLIRFVSPNTSCRPNETPLQWDKKKDTSDPGVPRIVRAGPRTIRVYGHHALLNGFRFGGHYTKAGGIEKPLVRSNGEYDYDTHIQGITLPALSAGAPEMWVAVFAVSGPSDTTATIRFVPFLRVVSYGNGVAQFLSNVGTLTPNFFAGGEALVVKESGVFSNKVVPITANGGDVITLGAPPDGVPLQLAAGDYVLPSPGPNVDYKYLRSLKLEFSSISGGSEWRNFVFSEGRAYSFTGNPFGRITNTSFTRELDFSHFVSPLATGVLGSAQAFVNFSITSSPGPAAYIVLSHDSSNHVIVSVGTDRTFTFGDGVSGNFLAGFGQKQSLWPRVNTAGIVGNVTIFGWVED